MGNVDARVLAIALIKFSKILHAHSYMYVLDFLPSGVSVATLNVENTTEENIFSEA